MNILLISASTHKHRDRHHLRWRNLNWNWGFTLVELLVVISILALLAGLLLPALARAQQRTIRSVCAANFRQWGIAMQLYCDDYGVYPQYDSSFYRVWYLQIQPYTGVQWAYQWRPFEDLTLKFETQKKITCPAYAKVGGAYSLYIGCYGYNARGVHGEVGGPIGQRIGLGGEWPHDLGLAGTVIPSRESEVVNPSDTIAMGDSLMIQIETNIMGSADLSPGNVIYAAPVWRALGLGGTAYEDEMRRFMALNLRRHGGGGRWNVLFCDGHVESQTTKSLFDIRRDEIAKRWNIDNSPHPELVAKYRFNPLP